MGESVPAAYMEGQWWRLITAGFLHGGILHILMNSWVLFDLGAEVEQIYGTSRLIVFYFVSTVTGFWASSHIGACVGRFVGRDFRPDRRDARVRRNRQIVAGRDGEVAVQPLVDLRPGSQLSSRC